MGRRLGAALLLAALCLSACPAGGPIRPDAPGGVYEVVLPKVGGGTFALAQCRGKVMMLDFFVTWSQASMVAIPSYIVLSQKHPATELCLVGIGLDDLGLQVIDPFVRGLEVGYPVLVADERIRSGESLFGAMPAIPTLLIFDRRGELVQVFVGLVHPGRIEPVLRRLLP